MDLKGKRVVVVGLGITGYYTALWANKEGAKVTLTDLKKEEDFEPGLLGELRANGIALELGGHREETISGSEFVFPSPGVPLSEGPVSWARSLGIPVVGELDIVSEYLKTPIIAITGTNGKSTVTTLIGELLTRAGFCPFVGGNLGTPPLKLLIDKIKHDFLVLEISSFQLDISYNFRPYIGILLNITPDHLERYVSFQDYVLSKISMFKNMTQSGFAILNKDDEVISSLDLNTKANVLWYGLENSNSLSAYLEGNQAIIKFSSCEHKISISEFKFIGLHNLSNLLPVLLTGVILGIDIDTIQNSIRDFRALPHRMELVRDLNGRRFIDDSKATNVDATVKAVSSLESPLILILGGRHKGSDYSPILNAGRGRIRHAVLIGEAKGLIGKTFDGKLPYSFAEDMEEGVRLAYKASLPGDIILLSPACSSFDMFRDYKHRGEEFKRVVMELS